MQNPPLQRSGLSPMELAAALSHLSSHSSRLSVEASQAPDVSGPAPHANVNCEARSRTAVSVRPTTAAPLRRPPSAPEDPATPNKPRPRPITAPLHSAAHSYAPSSAAPTRPSSAASAAACASHPSQTPVASPAPSAVRCSPLESVCGGAGSATGPRPASPEMPVVPELTPLDTRAGMAS